MRWNITEVPNAVGVGRSFDVAKGPWDTARVEYVFDTAHCTECHAPLAIERTSCRHAQAVRRFIAREARSATPPGAADA